MKKIILDCDPGHDDAMACLPAHGSRRTQLPATPTVAGNQTLDKPSLNARRVCTVAGIRDVPVAAGCDRPLIRELKTAAYVHGESGLDGPSFGEPTVALDRRHAVDLIIELLMQSNGDITLVPTGPLTNIAMAFRKEPRIIQKAREIVLMGGAYTRGNTTPAAEFNIYVDPEAAAIVFTAGWPLTMVGLDLTHQALATPAVLERIAAVRTPVSGLAVQLMEFFRETYRRNSGFDSPPVHDPCAVARVIDPKVMHCVDAFVAIETRGDFTSGMTGTDFSSRLGPTNAQVATTPDINPFWDPLGGPTDPIAAPAIRRTRIG